MLEDYSSSIILVWRQLKIFVTQSSWANFTGCLPLLQPHRPSSKVTHRRDVNHPTPHPWQIAHKEPNPRQETPHRHHQVLYGRYRSRIPITGPRHHLSIQYKLQSLDEIMKPLMLPDRRHHVGASRATDRLGSRRLLLEQNPPGARVGTLREVIRGIIQIWAPMAVQPP